MGFKEAINEYGKQITASFVYNGVLYKDEQILSMNPHYEGSLLKTVMKCLDIELDGELMDGTSPGELVDDTTAIAGLAVAGYAVVGTAIYDNVIKYTKFGAKTSGDDDYSYIEFGSYLIKESQKDEEKQTTSLVCYDLMLQSMIPYDLTLDYSQGVTVKDFLDAICDRLGWVKGYTTFQNCGVLIDEEKYDKGDTFRDVLDDIAEVAGGMIGFVDDALAVIYPTSSGEVINEENLKSLTIGKKYGPINSVVLSRTPQEDNIYRQDSTSIDENGMTEIRIENNQLMDTHREDFMDGICNALFGLSFELYDLESFGIGFINFGDLFSIKTADGVEHTTLMLCDDLKITQGVTEVSKLEEPEVTATDYTAAAETDKTLRKTILRVDKQSNEISTLVERTDIVEGGLKAVTQKTELLIDSDSVDIKISEAISGIDGASVKETGYTGYTFDKNGLNIHKDGEAINNTIDNTGMYVRYNGKDILVANDKGVNAPELIADKYLIVGNNARFEDYSNNRTACFYIGG